MGEEKEENRRMKSSEVGRVGGRVGGEEEEGKKGRMGGREKDIIYPNRFLQSILLQSILTNQRTEGKQLQTVGSVWIVVSLGFLCCN